MLTRGKPIAVHLRDSFLTTVVEILRPHIEPDGTIGDGHLFRAVKESQRRHFDAPLDPSKGWHDAHHAID